MAEPSQALVMRLRFRHLRLLLELQRQGSLGKAAAALHVTQPALTKMLQEVEDAFGCVLYRRTPRGLVPTPAGEAVLQGASVLLHELAHVHEAARASQQQPAVVLHLGVPAAVAVSTLPQVLAALHAAAPEVLVRLREEPVPALFDALLAGELDALLTSFTSALLDAAGTQVVVERCADHGYVVIAPAGHRLARRRKLAWTELAQERWILPEPKFLARQGIAAYFIQAGVPVPQPAITANSPSTIVRLVAAGLGVAWASEAAVAADMRLGSVVRLAVPMHARRVPTALVYRTGSVTHPAMQGLRQAVAAVRSAQPGP